MGFFEFLSLTSNHKGFGLPKVSQTELVCNGTGLYQSHVVEENQASCHTCELRVGTYFVTKSYVEPSTTTHPWVILTPVKNYCFTGTTFRVVTPVWPMSSLTIQVLALISLLKLVCKKEIQIVLQHQSKTKGSIDQQTSFNHDWGKKCRTVSEIKWWGNK